MIGQIGKASLLLACPCVRMGLMNEDIDRLEMKVSFLEAEVEEINEVVIEQGRTIDQLNLSLEKLTERVNSLVEEFGTPNRPSRRPPHY